MTQRKIHLPPLTGNDGGGGGRSVCASARSVHGERRHVGEVGFQIHGLARLRLPFYTREGSLPSRWTFYFDSPSGMTLRLFPSSSVDVAKFVVQLESISHLQHLAGITARIPAMVMIAEVEAIAQDADTCCMSNDHYSTWRMRSMRASPTPSADRPCRV